jgi:uncharacterized protein YwqG/predicted DNA-binding WGR domain protein
VRRFEFVGGSSEKFWEITVAGTEVTVRFGRLGSSGQTQTKSFESEHAAVAHAAKLIEEKLAKGYAEVTAPEGANGDAPMEGRSAAALADLAEKLRKSAPVVGPHLARGLQPAVRFASRKAQDSELSIGSTKLGGDPDLPAGEPWPTWSGPAGGSAVKPMRFFAQVDLSDVAGAAPIDVGLPKSGILSFFADFGEHGGILGLYKDEQDGCRVLFTPPGTQLERRRSPVSALTPGALLAIGVWTWPSDPPPSVELPDDEFDALDQLDQDYERTLEDRLPSGWSLGGRHQVGGHARHIQHPVEEEVVQAVGGCWNRSGRFDLERWEEIKDQVADWRLVLQLDSDDGLGLMWGDAGTIYWAVRRIDIAKGAWSAAMFNFQCS